MQRQTCAKLAMWPMTPDYLFLKHNLEAGSTVRTAQVELVPVPRSRSAATFSEGDRQDEQESWRQSLKDDLFP